MVEASMESSKVCLIVIDGWGISSKKSEDDFVNVNGHCLPCNAIQVAQTPIMDTLAREYAFSKLAAHGRAVGLPADLMGNSEVGHLNIGAGRVVYQDIVRIDLAIEDGSMERNASLVNAFNNAKSHTGRLHLIGLVSDGGVHSHINHLFAIMEYAKRADVPQVFIHAITDGRDTAPASAIIYLKQLMDKMATLGDNFHLASVMGRYYAMDRDKRWERTKIAFDALVTGNGKVVDEKDLIAELESRYQLSTPQTDEFFEPIILNPDGCIKDEDTLVFFNYRSDRMRQIVASFGSGRDKMHFDPIYHPKDIQVTCMTSYNPDFPFPVISPPQSQANVLAEWLSKAKVKQLHVAETEKYAHVTFFFNGGREVTFEGEERVLVPSPKVATYDLQPEMSVAEVADEVIKGMAKGDFGLVMCNFAPPDMVGHTGKFDPTVKAVEATDYAIGRVFEACKQYGYVLAVTADHGNAEKMKSEDGKEHTAHTCEPVPFIITRKDIHLKGEGALCDVAPTLLSLMGLPAPKEMTGHNLIS